MSFRSTEISFHLKSLKLVIFTKPAVLPVKSDSEVVLQLLSKTLTCTLT